MKSRPVARRLPTFAGVVAIIAMGALASACGGGEKAPSTSTTSTTTATTATSASPAPPPPSPTEKQMTPGGPNKFTPTHVEPPAPPTGRRGYLPQG
jgi:hypothetical protein